MVTSHNQNINGLSSSTLYHYRVHSRDAAGNLAVSGDYTFTTAALPACLLDARFEWDTLTQGMYYYTDRTYTLTGVPPQYLGLPMIKTPNSELGLTDASQYMTFELTSPATVYVAYDSRGTGSLPAWMNGFTYTGHDIQTSLSTQPSLMVYGRQFTGGCIDFGANMASPASGSYSNYIVFYDDGLVTYDYYCDDDGDGYIGEQSDGSCTGAGCEPAGCQTTPGNDCNDSNPAINQNAADDTCNGIDDNCDGTPDNNYVMSTVTCGTGVCTSTGQIVCQSGTEVNTCVSGIPPENPERTCKDGLDNDCDGDTDGADSDCDTISEVIIDNGKPGTSSTGKWRVSRGQFPYGSESLWSKNGSTYSWTFTPAVTGDHELFMHWTYWASRSTGVPVDIEYFGGTDRVYINQQLDGGQFNSLGVYPFEAGASYTITITAQTGPSSTCADAVKFVYIP
jgi:hypothetical protein